MTSRLADLDELVSLVRNPTSRRQFGEALACYNAGALRAAVVAAWTTSVYDIVEKIRELALAGDAEAGKQEKAFDALSAANDVAASLAFERDVLDIAKSKFELLSHQEHLDLMRLRDDRHRCAHPAMNAPQEPYQPTAELVRYHLHSVAYHLLVRPPVQGRAAVTRLFAQVESEYFPESVDNATTLLKQGPLGRAKSSLLRSFLVATLKALTNGTWPTLSPQSRRATAALGACLRMYPTDARTIIKDDFPAIAEAVADANLLALLRLAESYTEFSAEVPQGARVRLENFVKKPPPEQRLPAMLFALEIDYLRDVGEQQAKTLTKAEAIDAVTRALPRVKKHSCIVEQCFTLYLASGSWVEANDLAKRAIIPLAEAFTETQVQQLLDVAPTHPELAGANTTPSVLQALRDKSPIGADRFTELAVAASIHEHFDDVVSVTAMPAAEGDGPPEV